MFNDGKKLYGTECVVDIFLSLIILVYLQLNSLLQPTTHTHTVLEQFTKTNNSVDQKQNNQSSALIEFYF